MYHAWACTPYGDYRFLCYGTQWYSCGNYADDPLGYSSWASWSTYATQGQIVGGNCCNLALDEWTPMETDAAFCTRLGKDCGSVTANDNCGMPRTVNCGTCTGTLVCGGSGVPNVCGCSPTTCSAQGKNCGTMSDGCTGTLDCGPTNPSCAITNAYGTCSGAQTCNNNILSSCSARTPAPETGATCSDGIDNNCNGEADYDGFTSGLICPAVHGDSGCPVSINGASISTISLNNQEFHFSCTANAGSLRSLLITPSAGVTCTDTGSWSGNTYTTTCTATGPAGSVTCSVDTSKSYAGTPASQTATFNTYYQDADGDGYGNPNAWELAQHQPTGYVTDNTDCDDTRAFIHPGAPESCTDGFDDDCDSSANYDGWTNGAVCLNAPSYEPGLCPGGSPKKGDQDCPVRLTSVSTRPGPAPNQLYFDCTSTVGPVRSLSISGVGITCDPATGSWNGNTYSELCTGSGSAPAGSLTCSVDTTKSWPGTPSSLSLNFQTWYQDADGDGYGNPTVWLINGTAPSGYVADNTDCDDTRAWIHPGANEALNCSNGFDDNCDSHADYDGYTSGLVCSTVLPSYEASLCPGGLPQKGDQECPVGVSSAFARGPGCVGVDGYVLVNCTATAPSVRSIIASITDAGGTRSTCQPLLADPWVGNIAQFNCSTNGLVAGVATVTCDVDQTRSWRAGSPSTTTVQLNTVLASCVGDNMHACPAIGEQGLCNAQGDCYDTVTWLGNVTNAPTHTRLNLPADIDIDGAYNQTVIGGINIPGVCVGPHNLSANTTGYDQTTLLNIPFANDPTDRDLPLYPSSCRNDCTYGDVCAVACAGKNGCTMNATILGVCEGASVNDLRAYNTTTDVTCCGGPYVPIDSIQTPLTLTSCATQLLPIKREVNYNGRFLELTVITYRTCDKQ